MIRKGLFSILCVLGISVVSSCDHKILCDEHPHKIMLCLEFDWRDAPDATPDGMSVFFYPEDDDDDETPMRRFDFIGREGGEIDIREGRYKVICYNDTEAVLLKGKSAFVTHEAYTREGDLFEFVYGRSDDGSAPRARGSEDERVVISPDLMWGCTVTEVEITKNGVSFLSVPESDGDVSTREPTSSEDGVITLYPHVLVSTYTCVIQNVTGLEHVTMMSASLSGLASSLSLSDEELSTEAVTIPFEVSKEDDTTIVGSFLTFGHNEVVDSDCRLLLYVWMDDGSKYYYGADGVRFNVTDQVDSAEDKRDVLIVLDGLDLPTPIGDDNMRPSVDEWQVVNKDVHI